MEELDLKDVYNIMRKRSWIIALSIIIMLIISLVLSLFVLETEYRSSTTLIINDGKSYEYNGDFISIITDERIIKTLKEIAKSSLIINQVIDDLSLDEEFLDINENMKVDIVENTGIIKIEVDYKEANTSRDIANRIASKFIEYVDKHSKTLGIKVINKAETPLKPIKPNIKLNLVIGGILGSSIGVLVILSLEYIDNTFKSAKDIEEKTDLPVIGKISKITEKTDENIFNIDDSYKMLRININSLTQNNIYSILITSSEPLEGKSTIVSNLGVAMAQNNQNVLIIDCNLKKPCIHNVFDVTNDGGLTNLLENYDISYKELIKSTYVKNLDILTAGYLSIDPSNSSEFLDSIGMKYLLEEVQSNYDIALIDSPSLLSTADAAVLSTITDSTILICESNKTKINKLLESKQILEKLNINILGVVLNKNTIY
ncbi:polysaccharide biosynthesis tyrosine autokinase [Senegalia massiliensis]|uniref:non-specific protein-tyrosine kinase n=1 Tax=Senegalia massiliensis TaxID=1720316 RepID=A0A845QZU6_9CLOT|nr:polysaccharide biosynthesis tyrosine autokinase [Senegalia massiliensis]NBI07995.1 polysaccharide biosynthesis tyrosine autokinase [Senegalia massiliensis]